MTDEQAKPRAGFGKPEIVQVASGKAVVEWGHVRFADIPQFHQSAQARIAAALSEQNIKTAGLHITFSRPPSDGSIELAPGVMVQTAFKPVGAVTIQEIPAGAAAHMKLEASYDNLPQAWGALMAWIETQTLQSAGLHWEIYGDPAVPVTDLYVLLK